MRQEHYLEHLIDNDSLLQHNHIEVELIDFLIFGALISFIIYQRGLFYLFPQLLEE